MFANSSPDLKNRIVYFLKQDAGFENLPSVEVVTSKSGYQVIYSNISTLVTGFGEDENLAYYDFVDKWHRMHQQRFSEMY